LPQEASRPKILPPGILEESGVGVEVEESGVGVGVGVVEEVTSKNMLFGGARLEGLEPAMSMAPGADFFTRCGLPPTIMRKMCWKVARDRYPRTTIQEAPTQGFCSYTLYAGDEIVIQFRPPSYRIDMEISRLVKATFLSDAPTTTFLGTMNTGSVDPTAEDLYIYSMTRIPGVPIADLLRPGLPDFEYTQLEHLIFQFSDMYFFSLMDTANNDSNRKGRVGRSLHWRLDMMHSKLPRRFQPFVEVVMRALPVLESLPWVLTHCDMVPNNIMVEFEKSERSDKQHLKLCGLLDWAETECLPFGVGFYGLEELLGRCVPTTGTSDGSHGSDSPPPPHDDNRIHPYPPPGTRFVYLPHADSLREAFWRRMEEFLESAPADMRRNLEGGKGHGQQTTTTTTPPPSLSLREKMELARLLGILLWNGIAFDDGRLDRVVEEERDAEQIQRLDAMLFSTASVNVLGWATSRFLS